MDSRQLTRFKEKYPDRIPIIVVNHKEEHDTEKELRKTKFLVPKNMTASAFLQVLRKYINKDAINEYQSLIFFVDDCFMLPLHRSLSEVYNEYKSHPQAKNKEKKDFLLLTYSKENTFG